VTAAEEFVAAIEAATGRPGRRNGRHTRLLCPAHDDHDPSLDVAEGDDGRPLVCCRSHGCTWDAICEAIGWERNASHNGDGEWTPRGPAVAVYRYEDESGQHLFDVCRTASKDFPARRPDPDTSTGWRWSLRNTRRVLYRLPELVAAVERGEPVYISEGEKDVEAIRRAGAAATCNPHGAGKWRAEYSEHLRGADVRIVADRDEEGLAHARQVEAAIAGLAASVTVVTPAEGKDAADHLAAGRALDELVELPLTSHPNGDGRQGEVSALVPPSIGQSVFALKIVTLDDFVAIEEPGARALVGTPDAVLIPEGGDVMFYGDGGAGKSTLGIDLAFHLAAGDEWLGMPVAGTSRALLIENEGPRPLFRAKLKRKRDAWQGSPLGERVHVYEEPWTRFSFQDLAQREALAAAINELEVDVVIVGPVTRVGMNEAGTLQEVRDFMLLIAECRHLASRPITVVLIHHENKAGQVSGAFEASGDTLFHVQGQGHGRTRLYVKKARWASEYHATALQLVWVEGEGFRVDDTPETTDEDIAAGILAATRKTPGASWNSIDDAVQGKAERKRELRDRLLEDGQLVNVGGGLRFKLYAADDPLVARLRPERDAPRDAPASTPADGASGVGASPRPAFKGTQGTGRTPEQPGEQTWLATAPMDELREHYGGLA
jgi:hypothetical protein